MIITPEKINKVKTYGTKSSKKMELDVEGLDHIMTILSTNIYKNPLIFTQEMLANAWDSHLEAGKKDIPISIEIDKDINENWYCKIKDWGMGLSEERVDKVFRIIGKSTKKNDKHSLGHYGVGRTSAFAYTNKVNIYTVYNGIEYNYLWFSGETNIPEILPISTNNTDKENQTCFTIFLENSPHKSFAIENGLKRFIRKQTVYFDNLVYEGEYLESLNNVKNYIYPEFVISEYDRNELHLLVGQVPYDINWTDLGIPKINLPIALKFEVNAGLVPLVSRDTIIYSEKAKKIVLNKIKKVASILCTTYNKTVTETNDWKIWLKKLKNPFILELQTSLDLKELEKYSKVTLKEATFSKLKGINSYYLKDKRCLFPFYISHQLDRRTIKLKKENNIFIKIISEVYEGKIYTIVTNISSTKNKYLNSKEECYLLRRDTLYLKDYKRLLLLHKVPKSLWRSQIKAYQNFINEIWESFPKYEDIIVPKSEKKRNRTIKPDDTLTLYKGRQHSFDRRNTVFERTYVKVKDLKSLVIYNTEGDSNIRSLLSLNNNIWVVKCSLKTIKQIENLPNTMSVTQFKSKYNKDWSKAVTALRAADFVSNNKLIFDNESFIQLLSKEIANRIYKVREYSRHSPRNVRDSFKKGCLEIAENNNWWDKEIIDTVKQLEKDAKNLSFLENIQSNTGYRATIRESTLNFCVDYIKYKKLIKLNKNHYVK